MSAPPALRSAALEEIGVAHGFFGRRGGVSQGVYESLNAGLGSRDDPEAVAENRARIAAAMGVGRDRLLSLRQVHSARAVTVSGPWAGERPEADALVTRERGLALTALTADCVPVLLADMEAGVIGAAHAGWRGAVAGVLEATVAEMIRSGAHAERIVADIGPAIAQHSYEVGPEVRDAALAAWPGAGARFFPGEGDRLLFDLPGFCYDRLRALGLRVPIPAAPDTAEQAEDYFSARRAKRRGENDYGRNCSAICL